MAKMTVSEMIYKFSLQVVQHNGDKALKAHGRITSAQVAEIKAAKLEIIEEIERRDTDRIAAETKRIADEAAEMTALKDGTKLITLTYCDGEYLSGYAAYGQTAELLTKLGLAKYVDGWGTHVPQAIVDALGAEFTYHAAAEYAQPALDAKQARVAKAAADVAAKYAEAKRTGKPVILRTWDADCNDPHEQCSLDIVTEYALPNGTTKTTRQHTW